MQVACMLWPWIMPQVCGVLQVSAVGCSVCKSRRLLVRNYTSAPSSSAQMCVRPVPRSKVSLMPATINYHAKRYHN